MNHFIIIYLKTCSFNPMLHKKNPMWRDVPFELFSLFSLDFILILGLSSNTCSGAPNKDPPLPHVDCPPGNNGSI